MTIKRKKQIKFCLCSLAVLILLNGTSRFCMAKCPTRMGSVFPEDNFLVIAHRGSAAKLPENTLPAFQEALHVDGANALQVDLSLTQDRKVVLWHDWDPDDPVAVIRQEGKEPVVKFQPSGPPLDSRWRKKISGLTLAEFQVRYGYEEKSTHAESDIPIPTFQDFIEWAIGQEKLQAVFLKLRVPADERRLASVMLEEIKTDLDGLHPAPGFQWIFMTAHEEVLNAVQNQFDDFVFSFDREIPAVGIVNYKMFTTVPTAMQYKNGFAGIGLPVHVVSPTLSPWKIYQHILSMDFPIRDGYKKSNSNYIKIISWNFNDEKKLRCLVHLGVDGIVTDRPETLRRIALELGKNLD